MSDKVIEAVDALAVELGIGKNGLAFTWDQLERINDILSAHANELAEKVRAEITGNPLFMSDFEAGQDWAADFIDPEVTP